MRPKAEVLVSGFKPVQIVDLHYKPSDLETFTMARKMIREEGLLCGRFPDTELFGGYSSF